jgi:hypothetical protein
MVINMSQETFNPHNYVTKLMNDVAYDMLESPKLKVLRNNLSLLEQSTYDMLVEYYKENNYNGWINRENVGTHLINNGVGTMKQVYAKLQRILKKNRINDHVDGVGLFFKKNGSNWMFKYIE